MDRQQRQEAIQRSYKQWVNGVEFVTDTAASDADEEKLYQSLIERNLMPVQETK
jgi:hypothetical protein